MKTRFLKTQLKCDKIVVQPLNHSLTFKFVHFLMGNTMCFPGVLLMSFFFFFFFLCLFFALPFAFSFLALLWKGNDGGKYRPIYICPH
jgi:hypothetical protein